jgi:hypothetical protein
MRENDDSFLLPLHVAAYAEAIPGTYDRADLELLWRYCTGPWLELGALYGRSTSVLAYTGHPGVVIDWFKGSPEHAPISTREQFYDNMRGLLAKVRVIEQRFETVPAVAIPHGLHLVHLDGEHSYAATMAAFRKLSPYVRTGGVVVFHDAYGPGGSEPGPWPDVMRVIKDVLAEHPARWQIVARGEMSLAIMRRPYNHSQVPKLGEDHADQSLG